MYSSATSPKAAAFINAKLAQPLRLMDLTRPDVLESLGFTLSDLTKDPRVDPKAFDDTQRLAEVARKLNYDGLLFFESQSDPQVYLCLFLKDEELFEDIDNRQEDQRYSIGGTHGSAAFYMPYLG
jgi:hypothetical protein